jgi:uncharacterized protein YndB with AHSA1/START domain
MSEVVRVTRTLPVSPAQVFAAWTDPDHLKRWLCPEPGSVGDAQCDPVVGGGYRLVMLFPSGATEVSGEYLVVDRPRRLVFTWRPGSDPDHETTVSVELRAAGRGTEMTITHERAVDGRHRKALAAGWASVADKLGRLVAADRG